MSEKPDAVVIGVDFGTLSGRAVVVRVSDGAELGSAVRAYEHAAVERALPATGDSSHRTGRCRCPRSTGSPLPGLSPVGERVS
jgi:hypothetical protein